MIIISKNERNYLESVGFKFGKDIFRTFSKNPKYYAVESPKLMKTLDRYYKESVSLTVEKPNFKDVIRTER